MANSKILTAEQEKTLRQPIEEYVGKIQKEIDELRKDGTAKVIMYQSRIENVKRDKTLSKGEKDSEIASCQKELEQAKAVEAQNKDQIAKLIGKAENYLKNNFDKYYNAVKASCIAEKEQALQEHQQKLAKIEKVKKRIPNISLSTDIIVGFPTETKEDFEETLDVLRKVEYDNIFSFIYSRREGTPAAKLDFVLTDEEIHENFNKLLEVQNEISKRKNEAYVGRVEKVLVDGVSKNDETTLSGRCDSSKIVNFKGDKSLIGKYIDVRITEAHTWSLNGEIAE